MMHKDASPGIPSSNTSQVSFLIAVLSREAAKNFNWPERTQKLVPAMIRVDGFCAR